MKKAISFFAAVTLLVLVSCSSGGGGGDSLVDDINVSDANVQPARSVALSELPTTGRTTNITTDTALRTVLQGLQDSELLAGLAGERKEARRQCCARRTTRVTTRLWTA
jgi:hypothetical protein